ncbi:arsenic transporter [Thioclava dalianensis]|uniref:Arsenic transporter n=2 Tax=Thioclava dalianensis TaxID=1185766 RepID=A0A074TKD5_9RHOB|nr:SLC13 family permease [Thioclava dalianensis]KEP69453.1 arsenic transporter [Thioclava dalianensis]SFN69434.1 arsenical pump membrane protein [Thioclava dalianensis]
MTVEVIGLCIAACATACVILRPFGWHDWIFAVTGAVAIVVLGALPLSDALHAIGEGREVYAFLIGMMLLAEVAGREGLFDHLAARAVQAAAGSARRLFLILYLVGTGVTVFLSNDTTVVVLTPAVLAVTRHARVPPLPYLFTCAIIANAASFVLPISNPANLVLYHGVLPSLGDWLARLGPSAVVAVLVSYLSLRWVMRHELGTQPASCDVPVLSTGGWVAAAGLGISAVLLVTVSALGGDLGLATLGAGISVALAVSLSTRRSPLPLLRQLTWGVLPLVAGLFVLVNLLEQQGLLTDLGRWLGQMAEISPRLTAGLSGLGVGIASNLANNLPVGLAAAAAATAGDLGHLMRDCLMIGVDLGPNLSVTGSLATLLWLATLRLAGLHVSALQFLWVGLRVMPPALILALLVRLCVPG